MACSIAALHSMGRISVVQVHHLHPQNQERGSRVATRKVCDFDPQVHLALAAMQDWDDVQKFYGCGKFTSDSWRIFCRNELSLQVLPCIYAA